MLRYISADTVIPINSNPIKNGIVVVNDQSEVVQIIERQQLPKGIIPDHYSGFIIPGLVNTHCHLELSHMKGLCPTGTGLIQFIKTVVQLREFEEDIIQSAINQQDEVMWASGIQAVGDISNKVDTAKCKDQSPIQYYTFVELFDMMQPTMTEATIAGYRDVFANQSATNGNAKSFVPHAPYSVTPELFEFINNANSDAGVISIHNQETVDESQLFEDKSGGFEDFFAGFGMNLDHFSAIGQNSMYYTLKNLNPKSKNIFVHNTLTSKEDIELAHQWSNDVFWATCPNANMYIENKLPNYKTFLESNATMTIGTDSIMSNWQLDVWEEVKTIRKYQSLVPLKELLRWATINGAYALNMADNIGSIEPGKSCGLVHINTKWLDEDTDIAHSKATRIL